MGRHEYEEQSRKLTPRKQGLRSAARKPIFKVFMERAAKGDLKWCGTLFPTLASAQDAEMSLRQYEQFVFEAGHLDKDDPVAAWRADRSHAAESRRLPERQEAGSL